MYDNNWSSEVVEGRNNWLCENDRTVVEHIIRYVQIEQQLRNWQSLPTALDRRLRKWLNDIKPPKRNYYLDEVYKTVGDEFSNKITRETRLHMYNELDNTVIFLNFSHIKAPYLSILNIARKRALRKYGRKIDSAFLDECLHTALSFVRPLNAADQLQTWDDRRRNNSEPWRRPKHTVRPAAALFNMPLATTNRFTGLAMNGFDDDAAYDVENGNLTVGVEETRCTMRFPPSSNPRFQRRMEDRRLRSTSWSGHASGHDVGAADSFDESLRWTSSRAGQDDGRVDHRDAGVRCEDITINKNSAVQLQPLPQRLPRRGPSTMPNYIGATARILHRALTATDMSTAASDIERAVNATPATVEQLAAAVMDDNQSRQITQSGSADQPTSSSINHEACPTTRTATVTTDVTATAGSENTATEGATPLIEQVAMPVTRGRATAPTGSDSQSNTPTGSRDNSAVTPTPAVKKSWRNDATPTPDARAPTQLEYESRYIPDCRTFLHRTSIRQGFSDTRLERCHVKSAVLVIGDSNLRSWTDYPANWTVVCHPGKTIGDLATILLNSINIMTTLERVVFAAGINNRHSSDDELQRNAAQLRQLQNALNGRFFVAGIPSSNRMPRELQDDIARINDFLNEQTETGHFIEPANDAQTVFFNDNIHYTRRTGTQMVNIVRNFFLER
jgi:hypothetical protein